MYRIYRSGQIEIIHNYSFFFYDKGIKQGAIIKAIYAIVFICSAIHPMMRPRRPHTHPPTRSYSSQRTIQIKVTNPKLIASLEAARTKIDPTPPTLPAGHTNKGPAIVCRKTNFYHPEVHSPQPKSHRIPQQFSSNSSQVPTDFQTRPQLLANAALDVTEGYLEYKIYKTVDDTLFKQPESCSVFHMESPLSTHDDGDDE